MKKAIIGIGLLLIGSISFFCWSVIPKWLGVDGMIADLYPICASVIIAILGLILSIRAYCSKEE